MKDPYARLSPRLQSFYSGQMILKQYEIRRQLGVGVHGVVYLARDRFIHTDRVLKFPLNLATVRETAWLAHKMIRLSHPHIVQHYGVGQMMISGLSVPFLITEFVDGPSLAEYLVDHGRRRLGLFESLGYFADIAQALACAHSRGYAHGDIHRDNVLLAGDDRRGYDAKLVDFFPSRRGRIRVEKRSDVRETGLLLYEMLTRRERFEIGAMRSVPPEVQEIVRRCVTSRTRRFADGRQVVTVPEVPTI